MNTPSEPLSNVPASGKTVIAVVVIGVLVVAIAVVAGLLLANAWPNSDWLPVYQDVLKTSFQALAIGALGGLAKLIIDQRKAQEAAVLDERKAEQDRVDKLRDRVGYVSSLVGVGQDIDTARQVVRVSMWSWTDMVNDKILPARSRLRGLIFDLSAWDYVGLPVFEDANGIDHGLAGMDLYLRSLIDEYAHNKRSFDHIEPYHEVPDEIQKLPLVNDLINDGADYADFRHNYTDTLRAMRQSLVPERVGQAS